MKADRNRCGILVSSVVTSALVAGVGVGAAAAIFLVAMIGFSTEVMGIEYNQTPYEPLPVPAGTESIAVIDYAVMDLSLEDMAHDSPLIVEGTVLDRKQGKPLPPPGHGMIGTPTVSNTIQVDKVIKGNFTTGVPKTINVVTEEDLSGRIIMEDTLELKKNETVILFLFKAPGYGPGAYGITGINQGKYEVLPDGSVMGKFIGDKDNGSLADFEKNITKILSEPKPKKVSIDVAPWDRDMTTGESLAYEEKMRQEILADPSQPESLKKLLRETKLLPSH